MEPTGLSKYCVTAPGGFASDPPRGAARDDASQRNDLTAPELKPTETTNQYDKQSASQQQAGLRRCPDDLFSVPETPVSREESNQDSPCPPAKMRSVVFVVVPQGEKATHHHHSALGTPARFCLVPTEVPS
ncbi:hypothetical protein DHEL01_v210123 [Diaporthe helianthi]|uniref:Uncharacterized protein n=1 Tax=Diaporthe helianthi TaxID=158607 RepID=A0A2P5HMK5_DIAHE|nr:hypothetical protein DHEL01_v210123 [Diaporthe helianthi]